MSTGRAPIANPSSRGPEVERVHTPGTVDEIRAAFRAAFHARYQWWPGIELEALFLALWQLETGKGARTYNFNMGQVNAVADQPWYYQIDGGTPMQKRSYSSREDGVAQLLEQLMRDSRVKWREGFLTGDPVQFVRALKFGHSPLEYFEAPYERYLATFCAIWRQYRPEPRPACGAEDWAEPTPQSIPLYPGEVNIWRFRVPADIAESERVEYMQDAWPLLQAQIPGLTGPLRRWEAPTTTPLEPPESPLQSLFLSFVPFAHIARKLYQDRLRARDIQIHEYQGEWEQLAEATAPITLQFAYMGADVWMPPLDPEPYYALEAVLIEEEPKTITDRIDERLRTLAQRAAAAGQRVREHIARGVDWVESTAKSTATGIGLGLGLAAAAVFAGVLIWRRK